MKLCLSIRVLLVSAAIVLLIHSSAIAQRPAAYVDPEKADEDFAFQGEYLGELPVSGGTIEKAGVQIIALGDGTFSAVYYQGGLPGAGWNGENRHSIEGRRDGDAVVFRSEHVEATAKNSQLMVGHGGEEFVLKMTKRESPTLGKKPPDDAIVLFDGTSPDQFKNGKMTDEGLLIQGVASKELFQDCRVHLEFRLPYMPKSRGQARGNSGCYLQGRYEVQMLDSFGLEGKDNECGGIYELYDPNVNMCLPPLSWQTYDIDFTAARYNEAGEKSSHARITVRHNGVVIHENAELPRTTRAAPAGEGPEPGPLYLQDHGNPVRFRNIWVVRK